MRLIVLVVLALLVAGCVTTPPSQPLAAASIATPAEGLLVAGANATLPANTTLAPTWAVGDWWRFERVSQGATVGVVTFVVTDAGSASYFVQPDRNDTAVYDALYDIAFVGLIDARTLAGAEVGSPVKFFDWPLVDGKTWTLTEGGVELSALARSKGAGVFDVEAQANNKTRLSYTYDASKRWFTRIEYPTSSFSLTLVENGRNYTGPVWSASATTLLRDARNGAGLVTANFEVSAAADAVVVQFQGSGSNAFIHHMVFRAPDNSVHQPAANQVCSSGCAADSSATVPAKAGRWSVSGESVPASAGAWVLTVSEVSARQRLFSTLHTL